MSPNEMEERIGELEREVSDLMSEVEEMENARDDAFDARDEAVGTLRDEKQKYIVMLRRLEFSLHGLCPVCLGIVEHKTACDLKLAIWQIDHELSRAEYALL